MRNLFMPHVNNKGADQPAHPRSLISTFAVRCIDSIIPLVSIADISIPYLVSVAEQAGLSLTWSETPKTGFLVTWPQFLSVDTRFSVHEASLRLIIFLISTTTVQILNSA